LKLLNLVAQLKVAFGHVGS